MDIISGEKSNIFRMYVNVPNSKNTMIPIVKNGKTRLILREDVRDFKSTATKFKKQCLSALNSNPKIVQLELTNVPIGINMLFVHKQNRNFDYHNKCQVLLDWLVDIQAIADDNHKVVLPIFHPAIRGNEDQVLIWKSELIKQDYSQILSFL